MAADEEHAKILEGFNINWMNMRNAKTGQIMWEQEWPASWKEEEVVARIPKEIMKCEAVSREINFSSAEKIDDFHLLQKVFVADQCLEEWRFKFGFVIPSSTNSWQSTIEAADAQDMLDPETISGKVVIETSFMDGDTHLLTSVVRIFYV
mmetsp:Transcript_11970/g.14248  ORF Transcript_11970/g.14248 Transcript_11970/m.14248 type:complete len:150 (+) Transcript_11970:77-526(+)|eukprot:CAMPEP_0197865100 /NCGR_PEP_ID=MMETSP1438-20131217/43468_1 /TAXON_ID=1461541 /ORGANISM="Pterosperma sp., Strain CCMP1384" /LENGTH=149 /DNA_ID=CAMNT_0043483511 /DNA_START=77 /DNA_END=526 /DNA_ORIENTATION=+